MKKQMQNYGHEALLVTTQAYLALFTYSELYALSLVIREYGEAKKHKIIKRKAK